MPSNIHGFGKLPSSDEKKGEEQFSQGGKSSGTVVSRKTDYSNRTNNILNQAANTSSSSNNSTTLDTKIILYKNGFKIGEDGEFRDKNIPKNAQFINEIEQGNTPLELQRLAVQKYGNSINSIGINIVDKTKEEYIPAKPAFDFKTAIGGQKLGGNEHILQEKSLLSCTATEYHLTNPNDNVTTIQIVLKPRKKFRVKFNKTATILDIYKHAKFLGASNNVKLSAGYPPKVLDDATKTIHQAGLSGASINEI